MEVSHLVLIFQFLMAFFYVWICFFLKSLFIPSHLVNQIISEDCLHRLEVFLVSESVGVRSTFQKASRNFCPPTWFPWRVREGD